MTTETKATAQAEAPELGAITPFNEARAAIEKAKAENADLVFDYTKPAGIKAAKSHIYKLRQLKGEIDRVHKATKRMALTFGQKCDALKREYTADVDSMIKVHQTPLDEMEQREAARKARHEENMLKLSLPEVLPEGSEAIKAIMEGIALTKIDEKWEEYEASARKLRDETLQTLSDRRAVWLKREEDAVELERRRKEDEARKQAEREETIRREAEEKARHEAEAKAAEERRKAEAAAKAEAERIQREHNEKVEAERRKAAEAEAKLEAERKAAKAAEERRAQEAQEKAEAEAKRAADAEHRAKIIEDVAVALAEASGIDDPVMNRRVAEAIAQGRIPHVSMQF